MSYEDAPTLRPQLRELLTAVLVERFGEPPLDPAEPVVRPTAATERRLVALGCLALRGRRVLDLGAGVGDLARAARRAEAELVDAIDVDPERVQLGRLLCVLQGTDRVSWFEGDAGLASTYADEYDLILAHGPVIGAMRPILPRVAQNLRGVLVAELRDDAVDASLAEALPARRTLVEASADGPALVACATEAAVLRRQLIATEAAA